MLEREIPDSKISNEKKIRVNYYISIITKNFYILKILFVIYR